MKTRFKIDVATGVVTRSVAGVDVPEAQVGVLTARDILECEVQFFAGETDVTAQVLSGTRKLLLGLRQFPSFGPKLAQSGPHTLVDGVANCILDLNTAEIVSLVETLPTQATSTRVYFEVEVYEDDGSYRQTFAQVPFKLFCEVNQEGDEPPAEAANSAATATQQAAIATAKAAEALTSATTAAGSATAAATSAAAAAGSQSAAATSATNAATSATNAGSSATAAAASATNAASSATSAATSATTATNQATAAAGSSASAAASAVSSALSAINALAAALARIDETSDLATALRAGRFYF